MRRLLALLLMVWEPLNLALLAAGIISRLPERGWPALSLLAFRLVVASVGIIAGRALWSGAPGAVRLARWAVGLALVAVLLTYTTGWWPARLAPGVRGPAVVVLAGWHALWLAWLFRLREPS
ncbi:MAG TPA: hypothetical protein VIL25_03110 [Vicinamibacterales bacterium]